MTRPDPFLRSHDDLLGPARREKFDPHARRRILAAAAGGLAGSGVGIVAGVAHASLWRALVVCGAVGTAAVLGVWGGRSPRPAAPVEPVVRAPAAVVVFAPPRPAEQAAAVALPIAPAPSAIASIATSVRAADRSASPARVTVPRELASAEGEDSLAREAARLGEAKAALGRGSASDARRTLAAYDREFKNGILAQEAAALGIDVAVTEGGRAEAERRFALFRRRFPNSPALARLTRAIDAMPE
jgi:hypothetical protein